MKRRRKWLQLIMPLMAFTFLSFAQNSFAQNNQYDDDNNYDNSDEALIQPEGDVDYNTFHNELSPYGKWMDYPGYGNVWVCNVAGFRPYYTGGHWAYTRFGWTWDSDYNWGWAPFHYGRWSFDDAYGWFWVPGYTWGPAWVSWRTGGDYYGWAPLSPGLNISVNVGIGIPSANWVFLPHRYMGYRSLNPYFVNHQQNVTIIRNTTIINNTNVYNNNRFVVGPNRREVERYSGQRIQQQNIYVSNRHDGNRQVRNGIVMYNPNANRGVGNNRVNSQSQNNDNRQQPFERRPMQNGIQQPENDDNGNNNRRLERRERRDQNFGNNETQNGQPRQQRMEEMQNRRQQQNNERSQQQAEQMRQQQNDQQQQQQMNDRRQQMQQKMEERRQQQDRQYQQQDNQRQQMQQQHQQQDAQRQQQMQQRQQQQQRQQRNQSFNRPVAPQGGGGGRRRNG